MADIHGVQHNLHLLKATHREALAMSPVDAPTFNRIFNQAVVKSTRHSIAREYRRAVETLETAREEIAREALATR